MRIIIFYNIKNKLMPVKRNYHELVWKKYGDRTFLSLVTHEHPYKWLFRCKCGLEKILHASGVVWWWSNSCRTCSKTIHWLFWTRFYRIWDSIKKRCENPKHVHYHRYWGAGIKCDFVDFIDFRDSMYDSYLEHVGTHWEDQTTIDRIDNSKWYSKANCRWCDWITQNNNKPNNVKYTYKGETKGRNEFARQYWINVHTMKSRIRSGKTITEAIEMG